MNLLKKLKLNKLKDSTQHLLVMNPGRSEGFLELSKSYNININELNDSVSYSWTARSVSYNLLHYSRERAEGRQKEKQFTSRHYTEQL